MKTQNKKHKHNPSAYALPCPPYRGVKATAYGGKQKTMKNTRSVKSKSAARQYAVDFQKWSSDQSLSWSEVIVWQNKLYILAKRFNLVREFKENGII